MGDETTAGQRVKAAREAAGMTRAELADKLEVTYARISNIEADQRPTRLDTLWDVAVALGCRPSDLDPRLTRTRPGK